MDIVELIYRETTDFPMEEKYGLTNQIRRASSSIPSNIAEGSAKSSDKHFVIFLENSLGSCYEIETQLLVCVELSFITEVEYNQIMEKLFSIIKKLIKFIKYLNDKNK